MLTFRKVFILFFLLFSSGDLFSQWVLTSQNFFLDGDVIRQYNCDTIMTPSPGSSGANVVWDFSQLQYNLYSIPITYSTQVSFSNCLWGSYPGANLNGSDNFPGYQSNSYYYVDSVEYRYLGYCSYNNLSPPIVDYTQAVCTYAGRILKFPFTYGDTLSDHREITFTHSFGNGSYHESDWVTECDGWGTLILPWGIYDSSIRVHSIITGFSLSNGNTTYDSTDAYIWYSKSLRQGTLQFVKRYQIDVNGMVLNTTTSVRINTLNTVLSGSEEINLTDNIQVYPNPFSDKIEIESATNSRFTVSIYDVSSRKILQHEFIQDSELNTQYFQPGMYIYVISSNGKVIKSGKLVKN